MGHLRRSARPPITSGLSRPPLTGHVRSPPTCLKRAVRSPGVLRCRRCWESFRSLPVWSDCQRLVLECLHCMLRSARTAADDLHVGANYMIIFLHDASLASLEAPEIACAEVKRFNLIWAVQSLLAEISSLFLSSIGGFFVNGHFQPVHP